MKTKHRYGSHELCARLQHPAAAGSGAGGGRGGGESKKQQPCQRWSRDVGLGEGELQLHTALSDGRGGFFFFFPPSLPVKGGRLQLRTLMWCRWRNFAKHRGLRLSTKKGAHRQKPSAPRRSHCCKYGHAFKHLSPEIRHKKSSCGSLEPCF